MPQDFCPLKDITLYDIKEELFKTIKSESSKIYLPSHDHYELIGHKYQVYDPYSERLVTMIKISIGRGEIMKVFGQYFKDDFSKKSIETIRKFRSEINIFSNTFQGDCELLAMNTKQPIVIKIL